jgi:hypothetical protein
MYEISIEQSYTDLSRLFLSRMMRLERCGPLKTDHVQKKGAEPFAQPPGVTYFMSIIFFAATKSPEESV